MYHIKSRFSRNENISIIGKLEELLGACLEVGILSIHNNFGLVTAEHTKSCNTDARTNGVEVGICMSHNKYVSGGGYACCKLICYNTEL